MVNGTLSKTYTIGHDVFAETIDAATVRHLLKDGHGSTRQLVDATGNVITSGTAQVFAYDAYGLPIGFDLAAALTTLLYSGEQTDQLTGLQYLRARYYNAATGRFNRLDPFAGNFSDPQSLHRYLYTHGDPINGVDPTGLMTLSGMLSSMRIGLNLTARVASAVGRVFTTINTIQTVVDVVTLVSDIALGGTIRSQVRQAWNTHFSHLASSSVPDVAAIFTEQFWKESAQSFSRNANALFRYIGFRSKIPVGLTSILASSQARVVLQLPIPSKLHIPTQKPIPLPVKVRLGILRVGLAIQIGAKKGRSGRVLGFAVQKRPSASVQQIFRQDYHSWHTSASIGSKDFRWRDQHPGGKYQFHYHVPKKI